jgi:small subunit ribosomal protein S16
MAVALRLSRFGNRNRPFFRVNAIDDRRRRDGAVIEYLGHYDPRAQDEDKQVELKLDRCAYWLSVGAQPSRTVASLLRKKGLKPTPGAKVQEQPVAPA